MICDYEEFEFVEEATRRKEKLYSPLITVTLLKQGFSLYPVKCLLDSGADGIILPAHFATHFNIPYKKFYRVRSIVAGGGTIFLYEVPYESHKIDLFVDDVRIRENISFSEGQEIPLLGQDFFQYFKIVFLRKLKRFSLEPL